MNNWTGRSNTSIKQLQERSLQVCPRSCVILAACENGKWSSATTLPPKQQRVVAGEGYPENHGPARARATDPPPRAHPLQSRPQQRAPFSSKVRSGWRQLGMTSKCCLRQLLSHLPTALFSGGKSSEPILQLTHDTGDNHRRI